MFEESLDDSIEDELLNNLASSCLQMGPINLDLPSSANFIGEPPPPPHSLSFCQPQCSTGSHLSINKLLSIEGFGFSHLFSPLILGHYILQSVKEYLDVIGL